MEARRILSYFQLGEDKRPPKSIWHSPKKCMAWIEARFKDGDKGNTGKIDINDWERE